MLPMRSVFCAGSERGIYVGDSVIPTDSGPWYRDSVTREGWLPEPRAPDLRATKLH